MAPVVMVAVYKVPLDSTTEGMNVAVSVDVLYATEPATLLPPPDSVKVAAPIVVGLMATLKVAVRVVLTATPVAAVTGVVAVTVGPAGAVTVVKLQVTALARAAPALLVAAVLMVAV